MHASAGKGSGRRPTQVPHEEYASAWERIFGKKEPKVSMYKFANDTLTADEIDPKTGKVKQYKDVYIIAKSEQEAREKAKLPSDWKMVSSKVLSKDWQL